MQLRRIEVRDFRKLRHAVVDGLSDGLNVLVGDNEAGKSTLLAALRAVLFERHRVGGLVAEGMQPHGAAVRPEVTVEFDLKGGRWRLRKAFCQRPEAELVDPAGNRTTGDAVEERLVDLLGFAPPTGRGERRPEEHHGIYGLLWVEQASAHQRFGAGASRGTLAAALETEVGQVLGGERGRALLADAEKRRNEHWDRREPPKLRGDTRKLHDEVAGLEREREDGEARLRVHDDKVAALTSRVEGLARHARDDRLNVAVAKLIRAREAHARAAQLGATLRDLASARARAGAERDVAAERKRARDKDIARIDAGRTGAAVRDREAAEVRGDLDRAEADFGRAEARAADLRRARDAAERTLADIDRTLALKAKARELVKALTRLAEAEAVAAERRRVLAAAAAETITKKDLADLDRLLAEREAARLKRDAASVAIVIEPGATGPVTIDGVPHAAGEPLRLARDAVLDLPGFGRMQVRPGGGVAALARALDEAEDRLAARLLKLGHPSRDGAAAALARRTDAEEEAVGLKRVQDALAPEGVEALRLEAETLKRLAGSGAETDLHPEPTEAGRLAVEDAAREARRADDEAAADVARLNRLRETVATAAAVARDRASAAGRTLEDDVRALAAARTGVADEALAGRLLETERAADLAAAAETAARQAFEAVDPDATDLELRRATEAEKAIRDDIDTLAREKRELEIELRASGAEGLGERIAGLDGRLARLRRQVQARDLEARASLLLHRSLMAAQGETRDRWLGPVRDRVRPYLKLVQPDGDLLLNETTFSIEHLVRGGVSEPFESLSVGAREQVAVITRLALADILRDAGQPSAVILDDALVNTDEFRLERMHLVLQRAALGMQVLVLTCRESDFVTLGAPIRRL